MQPSSKKNIIATLAKAGKEIPSRLVDYYPNPDPRTLNVNCHQSLLWMNLLLEISGHFEKIADLEHFALTEPDNIHSASLSIPLNTFKLINKNFSGTRWKVLCLLHCIPPRTHSLSNMHNTCFPSQDLMWLRHYSS